MPQDTGVLERAASIASESLKKIEAPVKAKAAEEAKVASEQKAKEEQAKKDEGVKKLAEQEAKVKEDARIISEEDTKLSESDKKRKIELLDKKRKEDDTPDAKIKRVQEASQKRIDEIKSELLSERELTKQEIAKLKSELEELKKPKQQEDALAKSKREETERLAKYVEEDKAKPREQRREMSKEELEGWYLEDPLGATEWIQERAQRRSDERKKADTTKPEATNDEKLKMAKDFAEKQNQSRAKLIAKFPGIIPSREKIVEIRTKLGLPLDRNLNQEEVNKFNTEYGKENEEYRLCVEIARSKPEYLEQTNGPELVMAEMEIRLKKPTGKVELTEDELEAKIQAEVERRRLVDGEGITSTNGGKKVEDKLKTKTALQQKQLEIAKRAKMTPEQLEKVVARRQTISGAGAVGDDKE